MTVDDQRYPSTQGGNVIDRIGDFAAMVNPYARTAKMAWDTAKAAWQVGEGIGEKVGTAIGEARDVYNRVIPASKKVSGYNGWIGSEPSVAETRTNRTRQTAEPRAQNVKRRRLNKTRRGLKRGET